MKEKTAKQFLKYTYYYFLFVFNTPKAYFFCEFKWVPFSGSFILSHYFINFCIAYRFTLHCCSSNTIIFQ